MGTRRLIPAICTSIAELQDGEGSSAKDIAQFIWKLAQNSNEIKPKIEDVEEALKLAVEQNMLEKSSAGLYKLIKRKKSNKAQGKIKEHNEKIQIQPNDLKEIIIDNEHFSNIKNKRKKRHNKVSKTKETDFPLITCCHSQKKHVHSHKQNMLKDKINTLHRRQTKNCKSSEEDFNKNNYKDKKTKRRPNRNKKIKDSTQNKNFKTSDRPKRSLKKNKYNHRRRKSSSMSSTGESYSTTESRHHNSSRTIRRYHCACCMKCRYNRMYDKHCHHNRRKIYTLHPSRSSGSILTCSTYSSTCSNCSNMR